MKKRALILGVGGQDGSYLAERLLELDYDVFGLYRRSSVDNLWRIRHLLESTSKLTMLYKGDLLDQHSIREALVDCAPDEIYNLADQDDEGWSYSVPEYNLAVTVGAVGSLLEMVLGLVRQGGVLPPSVRVLQPVSAKMFGDAAPPQNERTTLNPMSPYACAKAHAYHLAGYYREVHGLFVSTAILYNHDSPRRGPGYLLQTICRRAVDVAAGRAKNLAIGDPDAIVDIGYAGDYVEGMRLILNYHTPDDFIIASGQSVSVRSLAMEALRVAGIPSSLVENLIVKEDGYRRPGPPQILIGDCSEAGSLLGYCPKVNHTDLIEMIIESLRKRGDSR